MRWIVVSTDEVTMIADSRTVRREQFLVDDNSSRYSMPPIAI